MTKVYQIMEKMDEQKKAYCFTTHGHLNYYMMSVQNPAKPDKKLYLRGETLKSIEDQLMIIWGHLLDGVLVIPPAPRPIKTSPAAPAMPTMSRPAGFPMPT